MEDIFSLLDNVQKPGDLGVNNRVLIVDGLNLYLRAFAVNGALNDNGVPVGGLTGFLRSLAYAIREVNPTRVIIVYDGQVVVNVEEKYTLIIKLIENQVNELLDGMHLKMLERKRCNENSIFSFN